MAEVTLPYNYAAHDSISMKPLCSCRCQCVVTKLMPRRNTILMYFLQVSVSCDTTHAEA